MPERIEHELKQLQEEGEDVTELVRQWEDVKRQNPSEATLRSKAEEFYCQIEGSFSAARGFPT